MFCTSGSTVTYTVTLHLPFSSPLFHHILLVFSYIILLPMFFLSLLSVHLSPATSILPSYFHPRVLFPVAFPLSIHLAPIFSFSTLTSPLPPLHSLSLSVYYFHPLHSQLGVLFPLSLGVADLLTAYY